jgi:hypothetical protein
MALKRHPRAFLVALVSTKPYIVLFGRGKSRNWESRKQKPRSKR